MEFEWTNFQGSLEQFQGRNFMNVATHAKRFSSGCWDLVVRQSGMALPSASQMVNGTELLKS